MIFFAPKLLSLNDKKMIKNDNIFKGTKTFQNNKYDIYIIYNIQSEKIIAINSLQDNKW
jgi:hypothetical protein